MSLVPQALTGELTHRGRHRHDKPISIERAASSFFTGLAFIFVAFAARGFAPAGQIWWFWLLIPAFTCMGRGIGLYLKLREQQRQQQQRAQFNPVVNQPNLTPPAAPGLEPPAPTTSELRIPSSVTENTTRHLDPSRDH
ncbi:MAG: hypothetical protein ACREEM_12035 [Blastocatellia bacterium]